MKHECSIFTRNVCATHLPLSGTPFPLKLGLMSIERKKLYDDKINTSIYSLNLFKKQEHFKKVIPQLKIKN